MTLKSIVAVASGEADDAVVLSAAAKLAARFGAHINVVPAFADPAADLVYYGATLHPGVDVGQRIAASERASQDRVESLARDVAAAKNVTISVEKRALQPALALAPAAILADLVVFGAGAAQSPLLGALFAETLLSIRAPVLLVKGLAVAGGPVAIAWDGSAQAGRAVRASLPLIQAASGVLLLRNVDDETTAASAADCEALRAYLERHGVTNIAVREVRGARVAESLLAAARAEKCELLVAGGYGRPRLFEMVLGGTTQALVRAPGEPNLVLSH